MLRAWLVRWTWNDGSVTTHHEAKRLEALDGPSAPKEAKVTTNHYNALPKTEQFTVLVAEVTARILRGATPRVGFVIDFDYGFGGEDFHASGVEITPLVFERASKYASEARAYLRGEVRQ